MATATLKDCECGRCDMQRAVAKALLRANGTLAVLQYAFRSLR